MKITKIKIFKIDLPMKEGSYSWAKQSFSSFDSTVVVIETDIGMQESLRSIFQLWFLYG